jgi:hypothetical protein
MARKIVLDLNEGREIAKQRYGELRPQSERPSGISPEPQNRDDRRSGHGHTKRGTWITGANEDGRKPGFDNVADRLKGRR